MSRSLHPSSRIYESAEITPETDVVLGENSWVGSQCFIHLKRLRLGRDSCVHAGARLIGGGVVSIGDRVSVGYNVVIASATDTWQSGRRMSSCLPEAEREVIRGSVIINDDVFIGANSVLTVSRRCSTLIIGRGAVIGALSFVDDWVPARVVGWGQPFREVAKRWEAK